MVEKNIVKKVLFKVLLLFLVVFVHKAQGENILAVGLKNGKIQIIDVDANGVLKTFKAHGKLVRSVAWSPDGARLASCSLDCSTKIWDVSGPEDKMIKEFRSIFGQEYARAVAWSPDGKFFANTQNIWETAAWESVKSFKSSYLDIAWSFDSKYLACGFIEGDYLLDILSASNWARVKFFDKQEDLFCKLVVWGRDQLVFMGFSKGIRAIFVPEGGDKKVVAKGDMEYLAASPNGKYLAAVLYDSNLGKKIIKVWKIEGASELSKIKLKKVKTLKEFEEKFISQLAWSHDGALLAVGLHNKSRVEIWDTKSWKKIKSIKTGGKLWALAFRPSVIKKQQWEKWGKEDLQEGVRFLRLEKEKYQKEKKDVPRLDIQLQQKKVPDIPKSLFEGE